MLAWRTSGFRAVPTRTVLTRSSGTVASWTYSASLGTVASGTLSASWTVTPGTYSASLWTVASGTLPASWTYLASWTRCPSCVSLHY